MTKIGLDIPQLTPAEGETAQESAYTRLRNAIMLGAIAPGSSLTIRGLAAHLGLSPTPVREAIRRLSSEGALEVLSNRRLRIPVMEPRRFDELIRLRIALETHAAARALPHVSDVVIEELRVLDADMDLAITERRSEDLTRLNHTFHRKLYLANPDCQAVPLIESVWLQLGPFQRQVVREVERYYHVDRHKEILAALKHRDPNALTLSIENDICDGIVHAGREKLQSDASI